MERCCYSATWRLELLHCYSPLWVFVSQLLVAEVHRRVVMEYLRSVMRGRIICTSVKMRKRMAGRLRDEGKQIKVLFKDLVSPSPSLCNPRAVFLNLGAAKPYWYKGVLQGLIDNNNIYIYINIPRKFVEIDYLTQM